MVGHALRAFTLGMVPPVDDADVSVPGVPPFLPLLRVLRTAPARGGVAGARSVRGGRVCKWEIIARYGLPRDAADWTYEQLVIAHYELSKSLASSTNHRP